MKKTDKKVVFNIIGLFSLLILLVGCGSKNFILSNEEMSWTQVDRTNEHYNMSISSADKKAVITSDNGGTLDKYLLNDDDIFNKEQWNNIDIFDTVSNQEFSNYKLLNYSSNNSNSCGINCSVNNKLRMMSYFDMNLDTGYMFISRRILPLKENVTDIGSKFELNLKKGGYLILPVSVISKYKNGYKAYDGEKEIVNVPNSFMIGNKYVFNTKDMKCTISTDAQDGYFIYIYQNIMLLVSYTTYGGKVEKGLIATIGKDSINVEFCKNTRRLVSILDPLELRENLALIRLNLTPSNKDEIDKVFQNIKVPLILNRFQ